MDVTGEALGILESHLDAFKDGHASLWPTIGLFALLSVGFLAGVGGIASAQRRLRPAAAAGEELGHALRTAMLIAVAIGLHNFAEGLAIGVSAQAGEIGLATVLVVGFALHNSTEGFGIVGPLGTARPSWRWLAAAGAIAGGPTLVGTMIGYQISSDALSLCFFALAGGAILYVIGEIWAGVRRAGFVEVGLYALGVGFLLGIGTDLVVAYGGA
jgi:ZIP family zinc transporter